jgi:site-specific recombinase XerD
MATKTETGLVRSIVKLRESSAETTGSQESAVGDVVQWFLDYYWVRHAISREMLAAYRADLQAFESWLSVFRHKTLGEAATADIRDFLDARSRAAHLHELPSLACIKRFYFFLVAVGVRQDDPTEKLFVRSPCQAGVARPVAGHRPV